MVMQMRGRGYFTRAIRVDSLETLIMRMRSAYDSRCKQTTGIFSRQAKRYLRAKLDDRKLKCQALQDSLDKTTDTVCTWLSVIKIKYTYIMKHDR